MRNEQFIHDRVAEIKRLRDEGKTTKEAAEVIGVTYYTIRSWCRNYGIRGFEDAGRRAGVPLTIKTMLSNGWTREQIAKRMSRNIYYVDNVIAMEAAEYFDKDPLVRRISGEAMLFSGRAER